MKEVWKNLSDLEEFSDYTSYQVSNLGRVRNTKTGRVLKGTKHSEGYTQVTICINGSRYKTPTVHVLVARLFIPNPNNLPQVNHKDEDKSHNWDTNLEWCDSIYNNNYGTHSQRISKANSGKNNPMYGTISPMRGKCGIQNTNSKPVIQLTLDGKFIREFECISQVKDYGFSTSCVSDVCRGKFKQHKGFVFKFKE